MRLFVAVKIPEGIAASIEPLRARLAETKADVRWVDAAIYHVTVKFLGEVEEPVAQALGERLKKAAAEVGAFWADVEGVGPLPERGPARVVVADVREDPRWEKLHRVVDSAVGGMGLPMDTRVLVPHVTLGRVRTNHGMNRLLRLMEKHVADYFGRFLVERVVLMKSELGGAQVGRGGGPRYSEVSAAELKVAEGARFG